MITRTDQNQIWDADGSLVSEETVETDVTTDAVTYDLHDKLRKLLVDAAQARAICNAIQARPQASFSNIAGGQAAVRENQSEMKQLSQVTEGLIRRLVAVARLTVGALDDNANT